MRDLWGFLLQTLTVSGAAVLVLVVKTLLCRQLSPRWQAGIWGLVGIVALLPAGWGGRYVLVNWPAAVETLKAVLAGKLRSAWRHQPPFRCRMPRGSTVWQWLFWWYAVGSWAGCLLWYLIAYVRLRLALRRGTPGSRGCDSGSGEDCCPIRPVRLSGSGGGRDLFRIYLRGGTPGFGDTCGMRNG